MSASDIKFGVQLCTIITKKDLLTFVLEFFPILVLSYLCWEITKSQK